MRGTSITTGLSRAAGHGRPAAPVRHVHLGLGNFFRAHQAVYTERAPDAGEWGIAGFAGRGEGTAESMSRQECLYTLVTQAAGGDRFDVVGSVSAAHAAREHAAWLRYLRSPRTGVVTLTVTESAYLRGPGGGLDHTDDRVIADIDTLKNDPCSPVRSVPGKLAAGLLARYRADAGPIAVVPCDNISRNGHLVSRVVSELVDRIDPDFAAWVTESTSFVTSMVDRITPRTTKHDRDAVLRHTGIADLCPVVTEPFTEWVLQGEFPLGRPEWDAAGAVFVADVMPYEQRKLWLLNGAHSLLAYAGSIRGHTTVADAADDATCLAWMTELWDEASRQLSQPATELDGYRQALLARFTNRAIRHRLDQIAMDGSQKLPVRVLPALVMERREGRLPLGMTRVLAAWLLHLRGIGATVTDVRATTLVELADGRLSDAVRRVLDFLHPDVGADTAVTSAVLAQAEELARTSY